MFSPNEIRRGKTDRLQETFSVNWALILIRSEDLKLDAICFPIVKMTNEQAAREVIIET